MSEFSAIETLNYARLLLSGGPTVLRKMANFSAIKAATLSLSAIARVWPIIEFATILKFFFLRWPVIVANIRFSAWRSVITPAGHIVACMARGPIAIVLRGAHRIC